MDPGSTEFRACQIGSGSIDGFIAGHEYLTIFQHGALGSRRRPRMVVIRVIRGAAIRIGLVRKPVQLRVFFNDVFVQQIPKHIAGHEQSPSGQVFKNMQADFQKKAPAARLLLMVNAGYGGRWA